MWADFTIDLIDIWLKIADTALIQDRYIGKSIHSHQNRNQIQGNLTENGTHQQGGYLRTVTFEVDWTNSDIINLTI